MNNTDDFDIKNNSDDFDITYLDKIDQSSSTHIENNLVSIPEIERVDVLDVDEDYPEGFTPRRNNSPRIRPVPDLS